jgi:hypothetical protein
MWLLVVALGALILSEIERLKQTEEMLNQTFIALSLADALYGLRSHITFVHQRVPDLMARDPGAAQSQAPSHGKPAWHQPPSVLR